MAKKFFMVRCELECEYPVEAENEEEARWIAEDWFAEAIPNTTVRPLSNGEEAIS